MALHVEHITKAFGEKTAVDDLSFSMEHSGVFGLIGTNGAGKTTTIRIILGIMKSDAGRAEWDGRPIVRENVRFGYMPEERGIYMKEKVFEQLVYFGMLHRMTKADASAAARRWLERLGITEYADYFAEKLSKGNQQKVQLIVTLLHDPELIILDEPFSGLDPVNTELFRSVIRELVGEGRYIVMSSHQMATVEEYCEN
ncbi:MAG: ATP-binding cassette domain-containing protein, partial [Clostridiales bacterium]|nr:ATP-binding cassette domain-containing protein [Clostridiales bacterium]